jgi:hypothetical protein
VVKPLAERPELEAWIHRAHTVLGEDRYHAAWARGRAMPLTQAIAMVPDDRPLARSDDKRASDWACSAA